MEQLGQAIAIAIIGGADGPTSMYVSGPIWRVIVLGATLFLVLAGLSIFGLVTGIKWQKKTQAIFCGIIVAVLVLAIIATTALGIYQLHGGRFGDIVTAWPKKQNFRLRNGCA